MKYLSWFTSGAVLVVAIGAFVLAFFNVEGLAIANDVPASRAWLVPVIVEGAMIALALTRLEAEINRQDTRLLTWLVGAAVALSIALNVAHSNMELWGIVIAVIQPVSLLIAFESFMYQLRHRIARGQQTAVNPWRIRAKWLISYARRLQRSAASLQKERDSLRQLAKDLEAKNSQLHDRLKDQQVSIKYWRGLGRDGQIIVRAIAGEITREQAIEQTGWDARTVAAYIDRMNGAAK